MPYHLKNHWVALWIEFDEKKVHIADSIASRYNFRMIKKVSGFQTLYDSTLNICCVLKGVSQMLECYGERFEPDTFNIIDWNFVQRQVSFHVLIFIFSNPTVCICLQDAPQQGNDFDCGIFTCLCFQTFLSGSDSINFSPEHIPFARRRIFWEILNKTYMKSELKP